MNGERRPVIAYISESGTDDRHAWSGTVHYVFTALINAGYTVKALGPARPQFLRYAMAAANKLSLLIFRRRFDYRHSEVYSRAFGRIFSKKLRRTQCDLVVICGSTECGAYLETDKPVYYVLDRTIQGAVNYHQILSNLWQFSLRQSIATDRKAMLGAKKLLFSSEWAASHAREMYKVPDDKLIVVPFGANMDKLPSREEALVPRQEGSCRLLLVGTSWKNKGADVACSAVSYLNEAGISASLTIVGCTPPEPVNDSNVTVIPFADKNTAEGQNLLKELYLSHHFFILPTRFDCTPIVFCEASAFGMPVLSADTGGVAGHIKTATNGYLIPYDDNGKGYAYKIIQILSDRSGYERLRVSTRDYFEQKLNWNAWAEAFSQAL
jgi:glycosyltransferase involved in cell wall biosynthesis